MTFYYEPGDFLGKKLTDELRLETYRTPCPDNVWENICIERKKQGLESKKAPRTACKFIPAFDNCK